MPEAWIIDAVRTPIGRVGGQLAGVRPDDLAAVPLAAVLARTGVPASEVDDVLVGCANQEISQDEFRSRVKNDLKEFGGAADDCAFCNWLLERLYYCSGDFRDLAMYQRLKPLLELRWLLAAPELVRLIRCSVAQFVVSRDTTRSFQTTQRIGHSPTTAP